MISSVPLQFDDKDNENPLKAFSATCVESPLPFSRAESNCFGDVGVTLPDYGNYPKSVSKNFCCSNGDHCNDCPPDLLAIPGVISRLPHSCKLPEVQEETTVVPTPHFKSSSVTGKSQ